MDNLKTCGICQRERNLEEGFNVCNWCIKDFEEKVEKINKVTKQEERVGFLKLIIWLSLGTIGLFFLINGDILLWLYFSICAVLFDILELRKDPEKQKEKNERA